MRAQLLELRKRGVDVCFIEDLAVVDDVAFDHQNVDLSPLGGEAFVRNTVCHMGANRSDVVQAVYRLDVDLDVCREVERGTEIGVQLTRRKRSRPPVVDTYTIGRGRR